MLTIQDKRLCHPSTILLVRWRFPHKKLLDSIKCVRCKMNVRVIKLNEWVQVGKTKMQFRTFVQE